jgi:hypothetical protein
MAENIRHFPVNWIEGMKINKNHFIELQDNIEDITRDARSLGINELNYGLLSTPLSTPFQYTASLDAHKELSVNIKLLKAITPGGGRIEITDYTGPFSERMELKSSEYKDDTYYIMLNVDPFQRIPSGEQNMKEVPPRYPIATSRYFITTLVENQVNQTNIGSLQFPIGKFKATQEKLELIGTYIPPCLSVSGHPGLVKLFEVYDSYFFKIEFNSIQIIQKIKFRNNIEDENIIATMVQVACNKVVNFIEQRITEIKWVGVQEKPINILHNIIGFARTLKNCFDTFSGDGKEMLFNYFSEWTETKSGDFERLFSDIINVKFKSYDIEKNVEQAIMFLTKMESLFAILNQLDYIGRKKDTGIFVNENVLKNDRVSSNIFGNDTKSDDTPSSSPSFLAD